jgi:hypothetical protein
MKAFSKFGLVLTVALVSVAAFAVGAQAQNEVDIEPDATLITGTASSPQLDYAGTLVVCDTGTAIGTTPAATDAVQDSVDVEVQFFGNCNVNGLDATVDCAEADVTRLHGLTHDRGPTNPELGEVEALLPGFRCDVVVPGVCTITVLDQTLPVSGGINTANLVNEGQSNAFIDADVDVNATRAGSSLCGPASGVGGFTGDYALNPTSVTFEAP